MGDMRVGSSITPNNQNSYFKGEVNGEHVFISAAAVATLGLTNKAVNDLINLKSADAAEKYLNQLYQGQLANLVKTAEDGVLKIYIKAEVNKNNSNENAQKVSGIFDINIEKASGAGNTSEALASATKVAAESETPQSVDA